MKKERKHKERRIGKPGKSGKIAKRKQRDASDHTSMVSILPPKEEQVYSQMLNQADYKVIKDAQRKELENIKQIGVYGSLKGFKSKILITVPSERKEIKAGLIEFGCANNSFSLRDTEQTILIVDDLLFTLKIPSSNKKRDTKWYTKCHTLSESLDQKYLSIVKKIRDNPKIRVLSRTGFKKLVRDYLKPCHPDFHRSKGAKIPSGSEQFAFSVVPKDIPKFSKARIDKRIRDQAHTFVYKPELDGTIDCHMVVPRAPPNVPVFLIQKEINYLEHHYDELQTRYEKNRRDHARLAPVSDTHPIPETPQGHNNCSLCGIKYDNYIKHIFGSKHHRSYSLPENQKLYAEIDDMIEDISSDFNKELDQKSLQKTTQKTKPAKQNRQIRDTEIQQLTADLEMAEEASGNPESDCSDSDLEFDKNSLNKLKSFPVEIPKKRVVDSYGELDVQNYEYIEEDTPECKHSSQTSSCQIDIEAMDHSSVSQAKDKASPDCGIDRSVEVLSKTLDKEELKTRESFKPHTAKHKGSRGFGSSVQEINKDIFVPKISKRVKEVKTSIRKDTKDSSAEKCVVLIKVGSETHKGQNNTNGQNERNIPMISNIPCSKLLYKIKQEESQESDLIIKEHKFAGDKAKEFRNKFDSKKRRNPMRACREQKRQKLSEVDSSVQAMSEGENSDLDVSEPYKVSICDSGSLEEAGAFRFENEFRGTRKNGIDKKLNRRRK